MARYSWSCWDFFCRDRGFLGGDRVSQAMSFLSRHNVFMSQQSVVEWRSFVLQQRNYATT